MRMFTRPELLELRQQLQSDRETFAARPELLERLLAQAAYGLDCAQLLDEAMHHPTEPYGEAEALRAKLTDGWNEIWNRHHY